MSARIESSKLTVDRCAFYVWGCKVFYVELMGFMSKICPEHRPESVPFVFPTDGKLAGEQDKVDASTDLCISPKGCSISRLGEFSYTCQRL